VRRKQGSYVLSKEQLTALNDLLRFPCTKSDGSDMARGGPRSEEAGDLRGFFPPTRISNPSHDAEADLRLPRELELRAKRFELKSLENEYKSAEWPSQGEALGGVQHVSALVEELTSRMKRDFIPQHSQEQLIALRSIFASRIFHVRGKRVPRHPLVAFPLLPGASGGPRYLGPELRQSDGIVFMALLNLCRDYRVGKQTSFDAARMAEAISGSYNGQQRARLKAAIQRLQRATIELPDFTVQLVQRFEHPKRGEWSVALDPDIVKLFQADQTVWLDLNVRLSLSEGLATWLYGYVRSQQRLIPASIDGLRERCGSEASDKTFRGMLSLALEQLSDHGVIDSGWRLQGNHVRWRKPLLKDVSSVEEAIGEEASGNQWSLDFS